MTDAPGPFSRDGRRICKGGETILSWHLDAWAGDEPERDEMVALLNRGTHFDEMLAALKAASLALGQAAQGVSVNGRIYEPRGARAGWHAVNATIAKAEE